MVRLTGSLVAALSLVACYSGNQEGQCLVDSNCNLGGATGRCVTYGPTGNKWCQYEDPSCAGSGWRWSDFETGDGLSGMCVVGPDAGLDYDAAQPDATPDAMPLPDATPGGGPNCMGVPATCGATGTDSCCTSSVVPAGTFYRDYDVATDSFFDDMSNPATLSQFRLDKYEITLGRFRKFVEAGKGTQLQAPADGAGAHPTLTGSGWSSSWDANLEPNQAALIASLKCSATHEVWTDSPGPNENRPMNCITWYEAMAFCIWDGGFLPTEAEWNYAATGGSEQRAYPWSSPAGSTSIDSSYAVYFGSSTTADVGSKSPTGDGRWGHSDLAGNVNEWTLDWASSSYTNPCNDCANLTVGTDRRTRGGSFMNSSTNVRAAFRFSHAPNVRGHFNGARCARLP